MKYPTKPFEVKTEIKNGNVVKAEVNFFYTSVKLADRQKVQSIIDNALTNYFSMQQYTEDQQRAANIVEAAKKKSTQKPLFVG